MRRSVLALLLVVPCAALAADFFRAPGGSGTANIVTGLQRGSVAYARLTEADNDAVIRTASCEYSKVRLKCNTADDADFDCSFPVKDCPAGITDAANDQCSSIPYHDGTIPNQTVLTGSLGRDVLYGVQAQVIGVKDATVGAGQTAQLEVWCF